MFLLDGLDEVPPVRRPFIMNQVYRTLIHDKVILTARPSASNSLFSLGSFSFYDIIPLPPASIRNLVTSYCKLSPNSLSSNDVLQRISNNIALQKLAVTPFILVIVCEIISYEFISNDTMELTQANLFTKLVELIQHDHNRRSQYLFQEKHLEVLVRFAENLSFFSEQKAIKGSLPEGDYDRKGLVHARFLNEVGLNLGKFEFVHLRLQEYFTALSLYQKDAVAITQFINQRGFDTEWLEVTCFLIGYVKNTGLEEVTREALKAQLPWIATELTGNGWYRLAKIQIAKGVSLRGKEDLGIDIYQTLLNFILQIHPLYIQYIELLLESDGVFFIKDLMNYDPLVQVWENVYRLTPISLRQSSGLMDLVRNPELRWVKSMRGFGFLDQQELQGHRKVLRNWRHETNKDLIDTIQQVGIASDYESLDLLKPLIEETNDVSANAAVALARIGGAGAACALANALIHPKTTDSEKINRKYADSLQIGRFKAIEPQSKELLCNWLCEQKAPYPDNLPNVLFALSGVKLNKQASNKVVSILLDEEVSTYLKANLLQLIHSIQDSENIGRLLEGILIKEISIPLSAIRAISYLPLESIHLLPVIKERVRITNERERLYYLSLLLKSYCRYPKHPAFTFVPDLLNREFEISEQKKDQYRYRVYLWQEMSRYDMGTDFMELALEDLLSNKVSLAVKSAALNYLNELYQTLKLAQIEKLKNKLVEDQKHNELKAYVRSALTYLLLRTPYEGEKLISFIVERFDEENKAFFTSELIKEAALSGFMIKGI